MESNNSDTNHSNEPPSTDSLDIPGSVALDLIINEMPRRIILPRRSRGRIPVLRIPGRVALPSITTAQTSLVFSNDTSTNSQNQSHSPTIPPLQNDDDDGPHFEESSDEENQDIIEFGPTSPTSFNRATLSLFPRRISSTIELIGDSNSDNEEEDLPTTFRFLGTEEEEEPLFMRNLFSHSRHRHQNEDEREEFERHRLEQFQSRLDSMITYDDEEKEEQEEQSSTVDTATSTTDRTQNDTAAISSADSSQEDNLQGEYDDINLLRTSVLNRFRRRIFGNDVSSVFHRQRIEKMMNDRFAYFWPVIHNWDPKTPLKTGYVRYGFIPPRK